MKLNIEFIKQEFEHHGYQLLSKAFVRSSLKLDFLCGKGHQSSISWDNFKQGHGCAQCSCNKKLTIPEIRQAFEQCGYQLLSTEYNNAHAHLQYICSQKHKGQISWNAFQSGQRCARCAGNVKFTLDDVKAIFEQEGYALLSLNYKGVQQKLRYRCPNGHERSISLSMFKYGQRCAMCHKDSRRHTIEEIQHYFDKQGYRLLSPTYENTKGELKYECPKGHSGVTCWNTFQQGHRCPECHSFSSVAEKEIANLYAHLYPELRNRQSIKPFELDVFFPTQKVAIEHNGLYWHSDQQERITPSYHRNKMDLCTKQDIRLLTIFEDEWRDYKDICISRINNALNLTANKTYARHCIIKQISNKEAKNFLISTHLQGYNGCKVAYGLYHNNVLIQVMTFGSPNRAHTSKGKKVLELKRLASSLNMIIVGGASKLFKIGLQYAKDNNYEVIKSYCDLRWGTGILYQRLGFVKIGDGKPSIHYTNGVKRLRNQNFAQNKTKTGETEKDKTIRLGLWKIHDCGHQTWEYSVNN